MTRRYRNGAQIRKSRKDMKEGPLGEIWENFFKPLLEENNLMEDSPTRTLFIDYLFGGREIFTARSKCTFDCPGGYFDSSTTPDFGKFNNRINRDSRLWVRTDEFQDIVDFETDDGRVFRMSRKQYDEIKRYITKEQ